MTASAATARRARWFSLATRIWARSETARSSGRRTSIQRGTRCKRQIPTGLDCRRHPGLRIGATTPADGSICPSSHHPAHRHCSIPQTLATMLDTTTIIPSFTRDGSSTRSSCRTSARMAAASTTRCGRTGSRLSRSSKKYLRLRYQMMPYIYSLGYRADQTGAPYMRALFMDFPDDPNVAELGMNTCSGRHFWLRQ